MIIQSQKDPQKEYQQINYKNNSMRILMDNIIL